MDNYYLATILLFAGNFAPRNFAFCHGQLLPIAQNSALFSLLGTMYGGDGRTTVGLPDLRGRAPIGAGQGIDLSNYNLGSRGGDEEQVLSSGMLPSHSHDLNTSSASSVSSNPSGAVLAVSNEDNFIVATPDQVMAGDAIGDAGDSQPVSIIQPYQAINYIICVSGLFPSRT